jgi:hypothetical protein
MQLDDALKGRDLLVGDDTLAHAHVSKRCSERPACAKAMARQNA